ncbi:hypothetical protein CIB48_g1430 [Xylaria polymorpha]|nr:hypothetical protein CIB48_g1430 [Xylaria polymorpha]
MLSCTLSRLSREADRRRKIPSHQPYERARSRIWLDYVKSRVIPAFHRLLQFQASSYDGDGTARLDELRAEFRRCLPEFAGEMAGAAQGPWFAGKDIGLVDITLLPWAVRLWVFDEFKGGLGIPEKGAGGEHEERWERWRVWLDAFNVRDSVKISTDGALNPVTGNASFVLFKDPTAAVTLPVAVALMAFGSPRISIKLLQVSGTKDD